MLWTKLCALWSFYCQCWKRSTNFLCGVNYTAQQNCSKLNWSGELIDRINFVRLKFLHMMFDIVLNLLFVNVSCKRNCSIWVKGQSKHSRPWHDIQAALFWFRFKLTVSYQYLNHAAHFASHFKASFLYRAFCQPNLQTSKNRWSLAVLFFCSNT